MSAGAVNHSPDRSLSRFLIDHRIAVTIGWAAIVALGLPLAFGLGDRLVVAGVVRGGEAAIVQARQATDFGGSDERILALVIMDVPDADTVHDSTDEIVGALGALAWVSAVEVEQAARSGDGISGRDRVIVVRLADEIDDSAALARLRALTAELAAVGNLTDAGARVAWTGDIAIREDVITIGNDDLRRSEIRALPLSFLILCIVFGAVAAALLPLGVGLVAMLLTLALCGVLAELMTVSVMVRSVASLLGLALGIDYSLLVVSQFRSALATGASARVAARDALRNAGGTVLVSGAAVSVGFAGLALVPVDQLRSIGIAGMAVAAFAALLATTLLPALLSWTGRGIDIGRLWPRRGREAGRFWRDWADYVCDHPWRVAIASALPLIALALFARGLEPGFPSDSWLPERAESVVGLTRLKIMGRAGVVNRVLVLYELPDGVLASEAEGSAAIRRLHIALNRDPRIDSVLSVATMGRGGPARLIRSPESLIGAFLSQDRRAAVLYATPVAGLDTGSQLTALVRDIRRIDVAAETGLGGRILVGGLPAATADYEDVVAYWLPRIIGLVACGSFGVLALAFRSLLIPLKAVLLNLLSVFAAYGAVVLIFIDGVGASLFGLAGPVEGVFPPTPILVFCAAFGISMDYEIFLLSGIARARRDGADERSSVVEGVARTGRLITSAALIMVVVFGAFAVDNLLPTRILGTALAIVVALDAVLIRVALGPAVIRLAGRWNWWPGGR